MNWCESRKLDDVLKLFILRRLCHAGKSGDKISRASHIWKVSSTALANDKASAISSMNICGRNRKGLESEKLRWSTVHASQVTSANLVFRLGSDPSVYCSWR